MFNSKITDNDNPTREDKILIRDNFAECVAYVFYHTGLGQVTTVQYNICVYLQESLETENAIIEQFRGIGKSLITAIFAMWLLLRYRDLKILVVSGSSQKAKNFVRYCYILMQVVPIFQTLAIEKRGGQRTSVESFDVYGAKPSQDPSVRSVGILGTITSMRANVIIADDVETKKNSRNATGRELLYEITTEFRALLVAGSLNLIIYLGTRHHIDSIYNKIRKERRYRHLICPASYPKNQEDLESYKGLLAPHVVRDLETKGCWGLPTDERFTQEVLESTRLEMGTVAYEMQMLLKADSLGSLYPLQIKDLMFYNANINVVTDEFKEDRLTFNLRNSPHLEQEIRVLEEIKYPKHSVNTIMTIDPSGRGSDLFSCCIMSSSLGRLWLEDMTANTGGYKNDNLYSALRLAKQYNVRIIYIESNFGDGAVTALLKRAMQDLNIFFNIEEIRAVKNKVERIIDTLEPTFNQQILLVHLRVIQRDKEIKQLHGKEHSLFYQMQNIINDGELEHDDLIDCLEMAVDKLKPTLTVSEERNIRVRDIMRDQEKIRLAVREVYPFKKLNFGNAF